MQGRPTFAATSVLLLVLLLGADRAQADAAHSAAFRQSGGTASISERVARELHAALDQVESFERELGETATWVHHSWTWLKGLSEWDVRNRMSTAWLRDAASTVDAALGWLDPVGALPRFGLQRYRILTVRPVQGKQTSEFGYRNHPVLNYKKLHTGCDYRGDRRTMVRAAGPGVVVAARRWSSYGKIVIIDHGMGVETRYAHLSRMRVREGDFVAGGAHVGNVGATGRVTGPHLHFEVRVQDRPVDPELAFIDSPELPPASVREALGRWLPARLKRNW